MRGKVMSSPQRLLSPGVTAVSGILGHLLTFTFIFLAISVSPWFTWSGYALSNLGDLTRSSAPLFNGGLIVGGMRLMFFVFGFGVRAKPSILGMIGTALLFASAVGVIGVGIFPMNFLLPHTIFAVAVFLANSIALFAFGVVFALRRSTMFLSMISIVLSVVASFVWFLPWGSGIAIPEFIASLAAYLWILIMCVRLVMGKDVIPKK
jgi:hypothetical membrane protein